MLYTASAKENFVNLTKFGMLVLDTFRGLTWGLILNQIVMSSNQIRLD